MGLVGGIETLAVGTTARSLFRLPGPVLRRLAGAPVVMDGKTLDPQMQLLLRVQEMQGPSWDTLPITRGRRAMVRASRLVGGTPPIGAVTERTIDGPGGPLVLRFYTPRGLRGTTPALFFLHGGGFAYGSLESHDALCRVLAEEAQVRVVAVDYRLAPEAPFPAGADDAWAALTWIVEHATGLGIDRDRIAVGGDSAGGNLAAGLAQRAARSGVPLAYQLLLYPSTDFVDDWPSIERYGEGLMLTKTFIDDVRDHYLVGDEDLADPRLSPLRGDVRGVAPAQVVTAGFDPLLDEGTAYAEHLRDAGVAVEEVCHRGLIHGFASLVGLGSSAPKAVRRAAAALQRGLV